MTNRSKGFSIIEIILVVAVVALLGFVGWRVWEAQKDKGNNAQNTQQNQQTSEQKSEEYVTIAEWGVRFKPVEGLTGVEYAASPGSSESFSFSNKELSQLDENCRADTTGPSPFGDIYRVEELPSSYEKVIKQIGNYYYLYQGPQSACAKNTDNAKKQFELKNLFINSLSSLEAIK